MCEISTKASWYELYWLWYEKYNYNSFRGSGGASNAVICGRGGLSSSYSILNTCTLTFKGQGHYYNF